MLGRPFFSQSSSWEPGSGSTASFFRRSYSNGAFIIHDGGRSVRTAVWTLIGLNTAIFGTWNYAVLKGDRKLQQWWLTNFTLSWGGIESGLYHTLLTSGFAHMGLGHFAFNMLAMHTFGTVISNVPGLRAVHIFGLAIGSALTSAAAWLGHRKSIDQNATDSKKWYQWQGHRIRHSALGASGIVMGMSATATCLMPVARMRLFLIPITVPLFVTSGLYVALDLFHLDSPGSRVGHAAHLGGFAFGAVYYLAKLRRFGGIAQVLRRFGGRH